IIFAWLVGVKARLFFYHTRRSYGMVIGDDFRTSHLFNLNSRITHPLPQSCLLISLEKRRNC
ncbi:MAG: hypothetical protein V3U19_10575, partial [Thermodesulfobacteriota bacterium]